MLGTIAEGRQGHRRSNATTVLASAAPALTGRQHEQPRCSSVRGTCSLDLPSGERSVLDRE